MKQKLVIALVLIVAAGLVYGAVTLFSPKPQYVLVPTDSGPGPGGEFGPPGDGPAPGDMAKPDSQPGNTDSRAVSEMPKTQSATVSVEEDNKANTAKQLNSVPKKQKMATSVLPGQPGAPPKGPGQNDGRTMHSSFEVVHVVMDIGRLEESKKNSITASQAKAILAVITPLRSKKTLSEAQAKTATFKLNAILNASQKKAISELPHMGMRRPEGQKGEQRPGSPPPSEGARPSGPPPNMGPRPNMDMNPLSSSSKSPMAEHINKMIKALEAKAKG